ncbi:MAG: tetratricopeptide repeat protein [Candidatus Krumholzibacteriia bacterium]
MAFLRKLFGGKSDGGYERAIALVEDGRLPEALPLLRDAYAADQSSPRGSLAGYYLRLSLVGEGRRLLQAGDAAGALQVLGEAVRNWPDFPDLRFLAGAAAAGAGEWHAALEHARVALRRNADYCEARLLEAGALQALARSREAGASLQSLMESGRRVDHALVRDLATSANGEPDAAALDLVAMIRRAAIGDDIKHRLGEAVGHCRAGRWDEGLAILADLARTHPRYPDVRVKHAAALYQTGRLAEALAEVDAALAVKPRYRTAVSLRGLVLAEEGRLAEAAAYLTAEVPRLEGTAGRHEELFLAYLRAALALLLGDHASCRELLHGWNDLGRQFARAELLLVACDDLDGWRDAALRRLDALSALWSADPELAFLRASLQLEHRQWAAVDDAIVRWPAGGDGGRDERALLLQARLDVAQGRVPTLPDLDVAGGGPLGPAWRHLAVHRDVLRGDPAAAADTLAPLLADGEADEETGRLALLVASRLPTGGPPAYATWAVVPDSWLPPLCHVLRRSGQAGQAEALLDRRRRSRPDQVAWSWLAAAFWLQPVRGWLA